MLKDLLNQIEYPCKPHRLKEFFEDLTLAGFNIIIISDSLDIDQYHLLPFTSELNISLSELKQLYPQNIVYLVQYKLPIKVSITLLTHHNAIIKILPGFLRNIESEELLTNIIHSHYSKRYYEE